VAHALCAGLAAAHARGVVHRDLKPANIMLNRAGQVIITDFGLAGIAAQLRGPEVLAGTPAYMAPEQLQARDVTARSDIYALGLVLYEIFTGARAFSGTARGPVAAPSLLVKELSPAIDRLILACVNDDPQRRPASAMAVAQALPGGDPIAAAMRAGQTPSPEMVAASRATVTLGVRALAACFVAVVALLVTVYALMPGFTDVGMAPLEVPPDVLVARARDIAGSAGYGARPRDYAFGFERDRRHLGYLAERRFDWNHLGELRPGTALWWYRESADWLVPLGASGAVTRSDPPSAPGTVDIVLDARSRQLMAFSADPVTAGSPVPTTGATPLAELDWQPLFDAAGLDIARFADTTPGRPPARAFDLRKAWIGPATSQPAVQLRVEAAALDGRPVSFVVVYPWSARANAPEREGGLVGMPALPMFMGLVWISLVAGTLFVRRNHRLGRLDVRGAAALAGATFWLAFAGWLLMAHLTPTAGTMMRLSQAIGMSLFNAAIVFVVYAGGDPYARRHWPASLVSLTRVVNGRLRDPLVGQDVLVGTLVGLVMTSGLLAYFVVAHALGAQPAGEGEVVELTFGRVLGRYAYFAVFALWSGAGGLVMMLLVKALLRRDWLAVVASSVVAGIAWSPTLGQSYPVLAAVFFSASGVPWMWTWVRFGMVAGAVATWVCTVSLGARTWNPSLWYGPHALVGAALILALAAYGFHAALAGRPLFSSNVLEDSDARGGLV
jgi:serine/threonine-protein kinase